MRRSAKSLEPTVNGFITMLIAKITQYDQKQSLKDPFHNSNFMSIAFGSVEERITEKFKRAKLLDSSDPDHLRVLKEMIPTAIIIKRVINPVIRAIDAYLESGKIPKYPVTSAVRKKRKATTKSASEIINELETRIARLEKQSSKRNASWEPGTEAKLTVRDFRDYHEDVEFVHDTFEREDGVVYALVELEDETYQVVRSEDGSGDWEDFGSHDLYRYSKAQDEFERLVDDFGGKKASMGRQAGRRYDDDEWVFFIHEETGLEDDSKGSREAERLREKFEDCVDALCDKHDLSICYDDGVSTIAWKAYASLVGHGTGLWDHEHEEAETLEKLVNRDRKCGDLAQQIEDLPYNLGLA